MATSAAEAVVTGPPPQTSRRFRAAAIVVVLIVVYLAAITSTHAALRGDAYGAIDVNSNGLTSSNSAEDGYEEVLSATRPGGKETFGVVVHNKGPVPITVLNVALARPGPSGVATMFAPAGDVQLGWDLGPLTPFHPVVLGPGGIASTAFSERVVCPPVTQADARSDNGQPGNSGWLSEVVSPVVVRYRVLGVTMSQTLSLGSPVLLRMRASACT